MIKIYPITFVKINLYKFVNTNEIMGEELTFNNQQSTINITL